MTPSQTRAIQFLVTALLMWSLIRILSRFLPEPLLWVFVVLAGLVVAVMWILKFHPHLLTQVYQYPGFRHSIDLICKASKFQPPVATTKKTVEKTSENKVASDFLLADYQSFQVAETKLKTIVRGHDEQITALIAKLRSNLVLRTKSVRDDGLPPLGVYLFVGGDGIGKRFLCRKLANFLYRKRSFIELDLSDFSTEGSAAQLFGSGSTDGALTGAVRSQPSRMIILQNIDRAAPAVLSGLQNLCASGVQYDPNTKSNVFFQNCVIVMTSSRCTESLMHVREEVEGSRAWNARSHEILARDTPLSMPFLGLIQEVIVFDPLSPIEKAEVISLLMRKECRKYDMGLEYVEPDLIADEIANVTEEYGFSTCPARIARLMHDPLVRASQDGLKSLVLRRNQITIV